MTANAASKKTGKPEKVDPKDDLKTLPIADVEERLNSSPGGLSAAEAAQRLAKDGPNELPIKKENQLLKFLAYFWGPIPWMIEVAVILSGVVGHWPDFFIILLLGRDGSNSRSARPSICRWAPHA
jgi:H+-transporting ATPase